ncbi:PUL domain-containing protein [Toxoplasma gondii]|uniref:PUL domain-containing protein n=1 Tax=Toxoplasma gondii TaxID=5811 RepID=A0A7J6KBH0_TOXGO|nr:PUL domain-containing protein [Toxoplasma gondii]
MASSPFLLAFEGAVHSKAVRCVCVVSKNALSSSSSSASASSLKPSFELVSGSLDSSVVVWSLEETPASRAPTGLVFSPRLCLQHHRDFVYCVAPCTADANIRSFFSGGKDKRALRIALDDGRVLMEYTGHEGPVCSLAEVAASSCLVTGSWDGSARLWNIASGECLRKLTQHKHAVAAWHRSGGPEEKGAREVQQRKAAKKRESAKHAILEKENNWKQKKDKIKVAEFLVSSAVSVLTLREPQLLVTGSQDKALNFWSISGHLEKTIPDAHDDIIRALDYLSLPSSSSASSSSSSPSSAVLSASNDQLVKAWSLDGSLLAQFEGHSAFVFDVTASRLRANVFFTASDDCTCKVWEVQDEESRRLSGRATQTLLHAATVWRVAELPTGDIVTCCEDGKLRVWTQDEARALPVAARMQQESEAKEAQAAAAAKSASSIDIASLPDVSQMASIRGQDGEMKMFREGNMATVYTWKQSTGCWERVGEVVGAAKQSTHYEGDAYFEAGEYDHIFKVEIGESGAHKPLPFRMSDNPLVAAEKFCAREGINKSCLEQITSFIRRNTGLSSAPSSSSATSASTPASDLKDQWASYGGGVSKVAPLMQVFTFAKGNFEGAGKKIMEFDAQFPEDSPAHLTALEKQYLLDALEKIQSPSFMKKEFRACELDVIFEKLAVWPSSKAVPVMDVWRALALHPQYHAVHRKSGDHGWMTVVVALRHLKEACASQADETPLILCCLRFLANLMDLTTNRTVMLRHANVVLESLASDRVLTSPNKNVRLTAASLLANFAVAFATKEETEGRIKVLKLLRGLMEREGDADVFYRCLLAVLTILATPPQPQQRRLLRGACQEIDMADVLPPLNQNIPAEGRIGDAAQDILLLLE